MPREVFLGLGSNLGDPLAQLAAAVESLREIDPALEVSPVYETAPLGGPEGQPRFFNCVVRLHSDMEPAALLRFTKGLEQRAGRVRTVRNGPRTLDVDILLIGELCLESPDLVVPHPRMQERGFVLAPLEDLDPRRVPPQWRQRVAELDPAAVDVRPVGRLPGH